MSNLDQLVIELAALAEAIDRGERDDFAAAAKELASKYLELDRLLVGEAPIPARWYSIGSTFRSARDLVLK